MVGKRHILGLAIDDCGIVATELDVRAGRPEIFGAGELPWETELTTENARDQGQRLRRFLRERGFTAKHAVVGLAARWVLAKEVEAPPAAPDALAGILGIQAERVFSMNAEELVFDYCGKTSTSEKSQVLLLATRRQVVDQIKQLAEAAGLQIQSITVSAFACGAAPSENGSPCRYGLYTRPTYCEFWGQFDGSPRFIKHIPMVVDGDPSGYADLLTGAIQRHVLLSSRQDQLPPHHVTAYDACGLPEDVFSRLNERLGPQITAARHGLAGLLSKQTAGTGHAQDARGALAAAAVALTAVGSERPAVDFLNPRIGGKKKASHKRILGWAAGVAAVCLVALGIWIAGWQADRHAIAEYTQQLDDMSDDLNAAKSIVDRLSFADSWGDTQPRFLGYVRELVQAFPEEGTIWVTSLALNGATNTGLVVGKATSETVVYDVFDKISQNEAFSDVKIVHVQDAGRNSREKEFAINFTFKGAK